MKKMKSITLAVATVISAMAFLSLSTKDVKAQKQNLSGSGTSSSKYMKEAKMKKQNPAFLSASEKMKLHVNKFAQEHKLKTKLHQPLSSLKGKPGKGTDTVPGDTTNMYVSFGIDYNNYYFGYYDSIPVNAYLPFLTEVYTDYYSDSSDITITFDYGDGASITFNPNNYYYGYPLSDFIGMQFHKYANPGVYKPVCTVTSLYDTVRVTLFDMYYGYFDSLITVYSGAIPPSEIEQFSANTYQWCDSTVFTNGGTYAYLDVYWWNFQNLTDVINVYINFGDGYDTTISGTVNDLYYYNYYFYYYGYFPYFSFGASHTYSQPGDYNLYCVVSFPDGTVDTAYSQTSVSSGCTEHSGTVFIDNNNNCIKDPGETGVPGIWMATTAMYSWDTTYLNNLCYSYFGYYGGATDNNGFYAFYFPDFCNYNDTIIIDPYYNFYPAVNLPLSCPASGGYPINTGIPSYNNNFAFGCQSGFDLKGFIYGWRFRPGFQGYLYPYYQNAQCDSVNGTASLVIDNPGYLSIDSIVPAPVSINGDTITWAFTDLSIRDWWVTPTVYFTLDTSANDGDTICTTLILNPVSGDNNPADNIIAECFGVTNSWDPNDKTSFPSAKDPEGFISAGQELSYIIRFQNTGSDTAYNISVLDTLDANLNMSTFKIITSSHFMQYYTMGNIVQFEFPCIMLPDSGRDNAGSNGFVSYSIKPKASLAEGTQINNTAHIFFDYNPAVVTNTTLNTIEFINGIKETIATEGLSVNPNPAKELLSVEYKVQSKNNAGICKVFNVLGTEIISKTFTGNKFNLDVSGLAKGLYLLKVENENGVAVRRFVKE